jgi:hypothetical protein
MIFQHTEEEWKALIQQAARSLDVDSAGREDLVQMYCEAAQQLPLYGSAVFRAQHVGQWTLPPEVDVTINKSTMQILDPVSKDLLNTLPYANLLHWEAHNLNLSIKTNHQVEDPVLKLQSPNAEDMAIILTEYGAIQLEAATALLASVGHTSSDPNLLNFNKGDVITVVEKLSGNWYVV